MAADKKVRIEIVVDEDTKGATKAATAVAGVRKESDKLDHSFKETAKGARSLDDQLRELYQRRRQIADQLSAGDDADLMKERGRVNRRIGLLKKLQDETKVLRKDGMAGAFDLGGEGIRPRNAAIGGAVGAVAILAPAIGAVIAGALSGTVVGAAMAGGILSAIHEPAVASAAQTFGESISHEFFSGGDAFVGPIIESLGILQKDFQDMNLGDAFAKVAPYVAIVAGGIGDLGKNLMPGFNKLLDRAGPFSEIFAGGLADLGSALGDFLDQISSSPGALEGLYGGMKMLSGAVVVLGRMLNGLADAFDLIIREYAGISGALEDIPFLDTFGQFAKMNDYFEDLAASGQMVTAVVGGVGQSAQGAGAATSTFAGYLADADNNAKGLSDTLFGLFDAEMSASKAADDWEAAIDKLSESVKENGKTLDSHTEKGRENRDALRDLVQAAMDQREANEKAGMSTQEANEKYAAQILFIEKLAEKLGLAKAEILKLVGVYEVTIITNYKTHGTPPNYNPGNASAASGEVYAPPRATGGPVVAGMPYTINERGRETVTFSAGGTVHPANLTPAMSGMRGGGTVRHVVDVQINGRTVRELLIDDALGRGMSSSTIAAVYP